MDSRKILKKQMKRAFARDLAGAVKPFTFTRDIPSTNQPDPIEPSNPYFDPVTETWIYPEETPQTSEGNPSIIEEDLVGIFRKMTSRIMDGYSLSNTDRLLTIDYDKWMEAVESDPQVDDRVSSDTEGDYRVVGWEKDAMDIFVKLYLRRNP